MFDSDAQMIAWGDQFCAYLRDRVREMLAAMRQFGWEALALGFKYEDNHWRLTCDYGRWYILSEDDIEPEPIFLDLMTLGVFNP